MKEDLFQELLESVREGGAILRKEKEPSRIRNLTASSTKADETTSDAAGEANLVDVRAVREKTGYSQRDFATLMGINTRTLQNWEQKQRQPQGAALVLLSVVKEHPDVVWSVVNPKGKNASSRSTTRRPAKRPRLRRATTPSS